MSPRRASQGRRTFVDTSAYFALLDADDANHLQARTISERLIAEGSHLFTTSFVLAETHALLLNGPNIEKLLYAATYGCIQP